MRLGISIHGSFSHPFRARLFRRRSEIGVVVDGVVRRLRRAQRTRAHIYGF
jgi:hypothetical protein